MSAGFGSKCKSIMSNPAHRTGWFRHSGSGVWHRFNRSDDRYSVCGVAWAIPVIKNGKKLPPIGDQACVQCQRFAGWITRGKNTMSKTIYRPEFTAFLEKHNLGTPTAAIERLRCLGLRFQDSKVRDLVKHPDHGGQPGAYFHHKKSRRIIGGEWLGYDKLCELLLKARDRFNEANKVEPKQSKAEMIEAEVKAYEERVIAQALIICGERGCRLGETSHGKESGNLWLKLYPKGGTRVGSIHESACDIGRRCLYDSSVVNHKVKVTTVLDSSFCQITVDSGHVRAAITAEVEKRLGEKQGALWMEGAPTPDEGDK